MINCIRKLKGNLTHLLVCTLTIFSLPAAAQHTDPGMHEEHEAVMNLVPVSAATHTAVTSGNWTNPATWNTNAVPGAGAKVVIPKGQAVTYDANSTVNLSWIRVDGKLQFATTQNTVLNVETIVVAPSGEYQQGTVVNPIPANITSVITFVDNGALTDPLKVARGLLSHGKMRICGAVVTPFLKTTAELKAGATQAMLTSAPANWKVGDQVAITSMKIEGGNPYYAQDEIKTITAVAGSSITFSNGLAYARKVEYPQWGLYPYMANTTRNIQYRSANTTDHTRKGHVMFMHNPDVDVRWAGFYDLGRTDKNKPVTDKVNQSNPPGDNPRGKYALHFHRTGHQDASIQPAYVVGCAVVNSPGWGFVNHDSYVIFEDNVSYNVVGAHFVCENGAERGAFRRNIAMKTVRPAPYRHIKDGADNHDLAHSGHGFWLQGGNVIVENNVASGCMESGFTWFSRSGGGHNSNPNQFTATALLLDPEAASGRSGLSAALLPIMSNKNNTAYACLTGMHSVDVEINGTGPTNSMIENLVSLNSKGIGILVEYYRNFTFKNCKILRDPGLPSWEMSSSRAIQAHNLIDHMYPLETRSADRAINLVVRNFEVAIKNFNDAGNDDRGEAADMAKWQVIGAPIDHNCPNGAFNNTGTYYGVPLVTTVAREEDVLPFPAFSPAAGTYNAAQTVSISSVPGASIYYVIGSHHEPWQSLEYKLKTGSWTRYTGPVTVNQNRRLIAVAVKDGQYSRIREGYYYIDATQPPPPPPPPPPPVAQTKYEAELAQLTGTTVNNSGSGFSGTGFVNSFDKAGDKITFTVQVPVAGSYPLTIRFKNSCGICAKWQDVKVNNAAPVYTNFAAATTGWQDKTYGNVNLNAGANTIEIIKSWGWTDIDYIIIGNSGAATTASLEMAAPANDQILSVYPNPVHVNRLNATVYADTKIKATISLLSAMGQKVWQIQQTLQAGNNLVTIPVDRLKNGIHFLSIEKGNERIVKEIVIQR